MLLPRGSSDDSVAKVGHAGSRNGLQQPDLYVLRELLEVAAARAHQRDVLAAETAWALKTLLMSLLRGRREVETTSAVTISLERIEQAQIRSGGLPRVARKGW